MKKSISIASIALFIAVLFVAIPIAQAGGGHGDHQGGKAASIKITTQTGTQLNAGSFRGWCGPSVSFMSAAQQGSVSGKMSGSGVSGSGGYDTGYSQTQKAPGVTQSQYGEQWGSVKMNSGGNDYHR